MRRSSQAPNPQQTFREEKLSAQARLDELSQRHTAERKDLEAAFEQLQNKFHQLSELAETSKVPRLSASPGDPGNTCRQTRWTHPVPPRLAQVKAKAQRRRLEDHIRAVEEENSAKVCRPHRRAGLDAVNAPLNVPFSRVLPVTLPGARDCVVAGAGEQAQAGLADHAGMRHEDGGRMCRVVLT